MRVLQIISGLDIGGAHGGAERFGLELTRALLVKKLEIELCAFWQRGTPAERAWLAGLQSEGVRVWFAGGWAGRGNLSAFWQGLQNLRQRCRQQPFTLAHSHFQLGTLAALDLKRQGLAAAALRTAHIGSEWGGGFNAWLLRRVFSDWVFPLGLEAEAGVSRAIVARLDRRPGTRLAKRQAHYIPNAIPLAALRDAESAGSENDPQLPGGRLLGSIGRLTAQKDYATLLAAFGRVAAEQPELQLLLVGDGEQRPALERQAGRLGISGRVHFLGQRLDAPAILRRLELFVLPSRWEGLPTVLLESMAAGVPVLATSIPGVDELVQDGQTGWLAPPGDPIRLAEGIRYALAHPEEATALAQHARQRAAAFSIESVAGQYLRLYRALSTARRTNPL